MARRGTPWPALVGLVVAASLLAACSPSNPIEGERAVSSPPPTVRPTAVVEVPVAKATPPPVGEADPAPVRLRIDGIDATLPVVPVGVADDGSMEIPGDPAVAGWYRFGAAPGSSQGSAVLAAHVDSRVLGIGPLARLRELPEGSRVEIRDESGATSTYEVESVRYIPREALPVDQFFAREGDPALVIITCGGSFDEATRTYSDNVVAIARPLGS